MNLEMIDLDKEDKQYGLNGSIAEENEIEDYSDSKKGLRRRLVNGKYD